MAVPIVGKVFQQRYLILSELGAGGMGTVFHARQTDADRDVALKVPNIGEITDREVLLRFAREFKVLSRLSNPHVMNVFGVALDDESVPFAICEYMEGQTLRQELGNGPLPLNRALKIAVQICIALQGAHDEGILHRDLKPENIFLLSRPEPDFVKVIDFGLASLFSQMSESQKITKTGKIVGSSYYISPELISGQNVDNRSDIYSFGCVLFEMLSGEHLFDADSPVAIIYRHSAEDPAPRLEILRDKVPSQIVSVLKRLLAKNASERYESMSDVINALSSDNGSHLSELKSEQNSQRKNFGRTAIVLCILAVALVSTITILLSGRHQTIQIYKSPEKIRSQTHLVTVSALNVYVPRTWELHEVDSRGKYYFVSGTQLWASLILVKNPWNKSLDPYIEEFKVAGSRRRFKVGAPFNRREFNGISSCSIISYFDDLESESVLNAIQTRTLKQELNDTATGGWKYRRMERVNLYCDGKDVYEVGINVAEPDFAKVKTDFDNILQSVYFK